MAQNPKLYSTLGRMGGDSDVGGRGLKINYKSFWKLIGTKKLKSQHFAIFAKKEQKPGQNLEVYSQKTENRPEYADFYFLLGNPPTCSEY